MSPCDSRHFFSVSLSLLEINPHKKSKTSDMAMTANSVITSFEEKKLSTYLQQTNNKYFMTEFVYKFTFNRLKGHFIYRRG